MRPILRSTALLALALAASCSSEETPQPNEPANQPTPAKPAEPPPEWKELQDLAASVHETFPELPTWEEDLARRANQRDGTDYLKKLGYDWKDPRLLTEENPPDWVVLRAWGKRGFERQLEREPVVEDMKSAIKEMSGVPAGMKALSACDVLTIFDLHDEAAMSRSVDAMFAMWAPVHRVELLMATGQAKLAEQELLVWIKVLSIADRNSTILGRMLFGSMLTGTIELLINGDLRPLLASSNFRAAFRSLREEGWSGYWDACWRELAYSAYRIRKWQFDPDRDSVDALKQGIQELRIRIATVESIGGMNFDPTQGDTFAEMKRPYSRTGVDVGMLVSHVYNEISLRANWLAFDLACMDTDEPLIGRPDAFRQKAKEYPVVVATLDEATRKVALKIDPEHLINRDLQTWKPRTLLEFELREPPKDD
jgi:hypothetical protein